MDWLVVGPMLFIGIAAAALLSERILHWMFFKKPDSNLWMGPDGVFLDKTEQCSECWCPWKCVNPTLCPRSDMYAPAGIAGALERRHRNDHT